MLCINSLSAQINRDSIFIKNKAVIVFTKDGVEIAGLVTTKKDSSVVIRRSVKDSVEIKYSDMKKTFIADENNFLRGKYVNPNIFSSFNASFATAFPIKKGQTFIRATGFTFMSAHIAFAKNACMSYYSTWMGVPVAANLRYSLKVNTHLYIAPEAGISWASWVGPDVYVWNAGARATQGNTQKNITIGIGYFELNGIKLPKQLFAFTKYQAVYVNFGYQQRITKKLSLLADAWYFSKPKLIAAGIFTRGHKKENTSWSFGLMCFYFEAVKKTYLLPTPMFQWNTKF